MDIKKSVQLVLELYPRIFFACHTRHVRDPKTQEQLSVHQASILDHLDSVEPTGLMELARHMGVTPSTMSINVERLVSQGYVVRARSPEDARRLHLRLTSRGLRIKQAHSVLDAERLRAVLSRLTADEREEAIHGLSLLASACQQDMHEISRVQAGTAA